MQILFGRLVAWLSAAILTGWTAHKALLVTGFLAFLATSLYSLFLYAVQDIVDTYLLMAQTSTGTITAQSFAGFTGLAGWLLVQFKLPQCLIFIVDIIMLKWTLRKIPFIKW